jgi:hypothetical protein
MTFDVYAQLEQSAKRDHGTSFDRRTRQARDLHAEVRSPSDATELALKRPRPQITPLWTRRGASVVHGKVA